MKNNKFLVFSDLHFEKRSKAQQDHLKLVINKRVDEIKQEGFNPVVLLAGDINNGDLAYDWIKGIEAQVYYTAGNHEFWECDFYDALDRLKSNAPDNAKFLYNDFDVIDDKTIILGCTLWTDVGESIKSELVKEAALSMNDDVYIKASKWYEDQNNIDKLENYVGNYNLKSYIEKKKWNILVEKEQNNESIHFANNFAFVLNMMAKVEKIIDRSSYHKKEVIESIKRIWKKMKSENSTFETYVESLDLIKEQASYGFLSDEELSFFKNQKNFEIFKKLSPYKNFADFKLVFMSHHLPFYEEIIIGRSEYSQREKQKPLSSFDYKLFLARDGIDYEKHNYLYRLMKGDFDSSESIVHIAHYFNNGHARLSESLKSRVDVFVHGHHHGFNYQDYLKNKMVVTNTGANGFFHRFKYKDADKPVLINSSLIESDIERESIKEFNLSTDLQNKATKAAIWCLRNTEFSPLKELVELGLVTSKNLYKSVIKNTDVDVQNNTEFLINHMALQKVLEDIGQIVLDFKLSLDVRLNSDFNMNTYLSFKSDSKEKMSYEANDVEKMLLGTSIHRKLLLSSPTSRLQSDYIAQAAFEMYESFKLMNENTLKINSIIPTEKVTDINSIDDNLVLLFDDMMKKMKQDKQIYEKICAKWEKEKLKRDSTKASYTYRMSIY